MKLALITSTEDPRLCSDDRLILPHLEKLGIKAEPFLWDKSKDFASYDGFVFRSCWNYHRKFSEFLSWLTLLEESGKKVLNPVPVSRWNLHKKYLLDIQVPIPKTVMLPKGSTFDASSLPDAEKIVVKPAVSLNGHETFLRNRTDVNQIARDIELISRERDVLLQEFVPEIKTNGEVSLVYLAGEFSHAIRKVPASGEFRVHQEYGGIRLPFTPEDKLLGEVRPLIESKPGLLYSRVDIAITGNSWKLIEWEIIDPMLYLAAVPGSAEKFALAIAKAFKAS